MSNKIFLTNVVSTVTEVHLYDETIEKIKAGHPEVPIELPVIEEALANAIVNPTHVEKSHGNSYVYVDGNSTNASGDPLRVPVKMVTATSGRVRSAYFATRNGPVDYVFVRGTNEDK